MAQQPSREFASTDPPTRTQDARFQESGFSPEISLNPRSHLQYFQCSTPSHLSKNAPSLSRVGDEHMARGSRGRLTIWEAARFSRYSFDNVTAPASAMQTWREVVATA